jgi:hypothetical protein
MHHRLRKLAVAVAAAALTAGLTLAGPGTARAEVVPASTWNEIFAPEINANGITLCADNGGSGGTLQLWRCHGYASNGTPQRWKVASPGPTHFGNIIYQIQNVGTGLCIGLDPNRFNAGTIAGSTLVQESCRNNTTGWVLAPAVDSPDPNNQFILENLIDYDDRNSVGKWAMNANTFLDQNGTRLIVAPVDNFNSAQWFALG